MDGVRATRSVTGTASQMGRLVLQCHCEAVVLHVVEVDTGARASPSGPSGSAGAGAQPDSRSAPRRAPQAGRRAVLGEGAGHVYSARATGRLGLIHKEIPRWRGGCEVVMHTVISTWKKGGRALLSPVGKTIGPLPVSSRRRVRCPQQFRSLTRVLGTSGSWPHGDTRRCP